MATRKKTPKADNGKAAAPEALPALAEETRDVISSNPEVARYQIAKRIAHIVANSGLTPEAYRGRENDCFIAIQLGHSIGLNEFQSVQRIAVIDGRPCLYGDALIGAVRRSGLCEYINETYDATTKTATCETKRRGEPAAVSRSFSWAEAETAGLTSKLNWKKYGPRMLQFRARGWCLRDVYADVLAGFHSAEEVMDYSNEPAPITEFQIPDPVGATASGVVETTLANTPKNGATAVTYEAVVAAFGKAKNMEELLEASKLTAQLDSEADIGAARVKYRERKTEILNAQAGAQ